MIGMQIPTPGEWTALMGAVGVVLTALSALVVAVFVQARKAKSDTADAALAREQTRKTLLEVKDQVTNTHATNLREDLTSVQLGQAELAKLIERISESLTGMKAVVGRIDTTVESIRGEARDDRARVERIDSDAHETHADIYRRLREQETRE